MAAISDGAIAAAVKGAGWDSKSAVIAVAVALAESGGNPNATNRNSNGSTDYGLFQINSIHRSILASGTWSNPADNARMAYRVYRDAGNSFRPWVAYTRGRHLVFMDRAKRAVEGSGSYVPPSSAGGSLSGATGFLQSVADPGWWIRVGLFGAGLILLVIGFAKATGDNQLSGTTKGIVKQGVAIAVTRKPV